MVARKRLGSVSAASIAGDVLARCSIRIPGKLYVSTKGQRRDLPACAAFIDATIQHRPEPEREDVGMDTRPATNDIMAVFMDRDDNRQGNNKGQKRPDQPAKLRNQCENIQNSTLPFLLLRPTRPVLPDGPLGPRYQE